MVQAADMGFVTFDRWGRGNQCGRGNRADEGTSADVGTGADDGNRGGRRNRAGLRNRGGRRNRGRTTERPGWDVSGPAQPPALRGRRALSRRLGLADAVVLGLGAMLGTGVFVVFAPAAAAAGSGAGRAARGGGGRLRNATSSARLAARYPESGGSYVYGRERLGTVRGFLAGLGVRGRQDGELRGDGADRRGVPAARGRPGSSRSARCSRSPR